MNKFEKMITLYTAPFAQQLFSDKLLSLNCQEAVSKGGVYPLFKSLSSGI
jgi:hypothetical protein